MVGICGVFGDRDHDISSLDAVDSALCLTGDEQREEYRSDGADVVVASHPFFADDQPATLSDDKLLWIWGDIKGYEDDSGSLTRCTGAGNATVCAERYDRDGTGFVERLSGEFVGAIYDPDEHTVQLFTDRLGVRQMFVAHGEDGELLVSTCLDLIGAYPGFEPTIDEAILCEYLAHYQTFGTATPIEGVEKVPPATIVEYDLESGESTTERYWYPTYEPADISYDDFVETFVSTFRDAVRDCLEVDTDHGLALSGGSDSRLLAGVLADLGTEFTSFHYTDWESRETRVARQVAEVVDSEFQILDQGEAHLAEVWSHAPETFTFNGSFATGYSPTNRERIDNDADILLFAWGSDFFFKRFSVPLRTVSLFGRSYELPILDSVESVAEYVDDLSVPVPEYVPGYETTTPILEAQIRQDGSEIRHHGVRYRSPGDLARLENFFPAWNNYGYWMYERPLQMAPRRSPFVDNRMIDLRLSSPAPYRARKNVIYDAVETVDPELAAMPHASAWLPLTYPYLAHWAVEVLPPLGWLRDLFRPTSTPEPHLTNEAWPDFESYLRMDFGENAMAESQAVVDAIPGIDGAIYRRMCDEQLDGADHWRALSTLLTVAQMPVTGEVVD